MHVFPPNPDYSIFLFVINQLSKCRTSKHLLKLFPDTNFNAEIPDMFGKFRTYGNPMITRLDVILASSVLPHSFLSSSNDGLMSLMLVIKLVSNPCPQTWHLFLNLLLSFFLLHSEFTFSHSTFVLPLHLT